MYCSSCGVAVTQGLSYCKQCGANLNPVTVDKSSDVKPGLLVPAMVFLFVFGLFAITILIGVMKSELGFNEAQVLAFASMSFLTMLGLEVVFVSMLFRRQRRNHQIETLKLKERATNELDAAQTPALPEGVPSVTEHTTRAFDPVYIERK
ncbi:MAG: hypothetical protein C5B55_05155 [Blastocatellia bacterium]|nr:MAG: hypothetical protein C5B55_05155 [Blastocatellia bacterium]